MICKQCARWASSLGHARCMARNVGKHTKDCDCQHRTYKALRAASGQPLRRQYIEALMLMNSGNVIDSTETKDDTNEYE